MCVHVSVYLLHTIYHTIQKDDIKYFFFHLILKNGRRYSDQVLVQGACTHARSMDFWRLKPGRWACLITGTSLEHAEGCHPPRSRGVISRFVFVSVCLFFFGRDQYELGMLAKKEKAEECFIMAARDCLNSFLALVSFLLTETYSVLIKSIKNTFTRLNIYICTYTLYLKVLTSQPINLDEKRSLCKNEI